MMPIFEKLLRYSATVRIDLITGESVLVQPAKIIVLYSARTRKGGEVYGIGQDGLTAVVAALSFLDAEAAKELEDGLGRVAELEIEYAAYHVKQSSAKFSFSGSFPDGGGVTDEFFGMDAIVDAASELSIALKI